MRNFIHYLILVFVFCQCRFSETSESELIITHFPDGKVKAEVPMKEGKKHGLAKSYYSNGRLWQEVNYIKGQKHGLARTYYKTGFIYLETPYYEGQMHGTRKSYRRNGQLLAEIPYVYGKPSAGLKEYLLNGEEKRIYPAIQVHPVITENAYVLQFSLSDRVKDVEFYFGALNEDRLIPYNASKIPDNEDGIPEVIFPIDKAEKISESFMVMARATTIHGNPYITEQVHHIKVN